jgi:hypothetical protein
LTRKTKHFMNCPKCDIDMLTEFRYSEQGGMHGDFVCPECGKREDMETGLAWEMWFTQWYLRESWKYRNARWDFEKLEGHPRNCRWCKHYNYDGKGSMATMYDYCELGMQGNNVTKFNITKPCKKYTPRDHCHCPYNLAHRRAYHDPYQRF